MLRQVNSILLYKTSGRRHHNFIQHKPRKSGFSKAVEHIAIRQMNRFGNGRKTSIVTPKDFRAARFQKQGLGVGRVAGGAAAADDGVWDGVSQLPKSAPIHVKQQYLDQQDFEQEDEAQREQQRQQRAMTGIDDDDDGSSSAGSGDNNNLSSWERERAAIRRRAIKSIMRDKQCEAAAAAFSSGGGSNADSSSSSSSVVGGPTKSKRNDFGRVVEGKQDGDGDDDDENEDATKDPKHQQAFLDKNREFNEKHRASQAPPQSPEEHQQNFDALLERAIVLFANPNRDSLRTAEILDVLLKVDPNFSAMSKFGAPELTYLLRNSQFLKAWRGKWAFVRCFDPERDSITIKLEAYKYQEAPSIDGARSLPDKHSPMMKRWS